MLCLLIICFGWITIITYHHRRFDLSHWYFFLFHESRGTLGFFQPRYWTPSTLSSAKRAMASLCPWDVPREASIFVSKWFPLGTKLLQYPKRYKWYKFCIIVAQFEAIWQWFTSREVCVFFMIASCLFHTVPRHSSSSTVVACASENAPPEPSGYQTIQVGWGFAVLLSPKIPCMVYRYSTHIPYKKINKSLVNTTKYLWIDVCIGNLNTDRVFQRVLGEVIRSSTWFPTAALRSQEGQQRFQPRICRRHVLGWSPIHRFTDDANWF